MFTSIIIGIFLLITSHLALSTPTSLSASTRDLILEGYETVSPTWTIPHGGQEIQVNGSVHDVLDYMTVNFPDFKPGVTSNNDKDITSGDYNPLRPREMILPPLCVPVGNWPWKGAPDVPGAKGVMDTVPGNIKFVARSCENLVCQHQTSLNICVDDYQDVVASGTYIGRLAEGLIDQCTDENNLVGGQMFDTNQFNVIAYYDGTCP